MAAATDRKTTSSAKAEQARDLVAQPLTPDEQYQVVKQASFLADLKAKAQQAFGALQGAGATADTLRFDVDGVPCSVTFHGADVIVNVGTPAAPPAAALYTWQAPVAWLGISA